MNDRIQTLKNRLAGQNIQGMIISNPINIKYFTGIEAEGILLITRKENIYLTDSRYIEYVNSILTPFDEIIVENFKNISQDEYENFFLFCENIGFEENFVTYAKYKEFMHKYKVNNLVEAEEIISQIRSIKDDEEINSIKSACEITDKCFSFLLKYIKPGLTEKQIARKIEEYFRQKAEGLAFDTIVASGQNSSKPHAKPTDRKIQSKDIITIDMGCKINGYCSDMTRTIFIGKITQEQKKVYDLVLDLQKRILNEMKHGANTKILAQMQENELKLNGFETMHSLGHGVGMEIHEEPYFRTNKDCILKENMVITDEPGIYIAENFGIRIEDTALVTKENPQILTMASKKCIIL